jgi:RNA polymerase sigma factor (sigma-70 family)
VTQEHGGHHWGGVRHRDGWMSQPDPTLSAELVAEVPRLRALARCLVRDDDPEDVAQQAALAALTQPSRPRSLRSWLAQIVRNEHRMRSRSRVRRRARETHALETDAIPDLEAELTRAQLLDALRGIVDELDEPYRAVLVARFFEDRCAAEIARAQNCPAATIRWRVQEALRRTRRKLDERFHGRREWFGGMAAFGFPLASTPIAITSRVSKMKIMAFVKALAAVGIIGAAATLAVATVTEVTASNERQPLERDEPSQVASRDLPGARARERAKPPVHGFESEVHHERGRDDAPSCADHPECAGPPISSDILQDCFAGSGLELGESVHVLLHLGEGDATGRLVDRVEASNLEGVEIADASACLTAKVAGSALQMPGLDDEMSSIMLSLVADGHGAPGFDNPQWPTQSDALDPMQAIADFRLPRRGPASAKVSIVECGDFDCRFCSQARETIDRIEASYGEDVAIHWMHNPLPHHETAHLAARAAFAAGEQGKFWEMHDLLFDEPDARSPAALSGLAGQLDLDVIRFARDLESDAAHSAVEEQVAVCMGNGARGTPSFFIAGDLLIGARPYDDFQTILDDELAR